MIFENMFISLLTLEKNLMIIDTIQTFRISYTKYS